MKVINLGIYKCEVDNWATHICLVSYIPTPLGNVEKFKKLIKINNKKVSYIDRVIQCFTIYLKMKF